jgi:hypothetical protein
MPGLKLTYKKKMAILPWSLGVLSCHMKKLDCLAGETRYKEPEITQRRNKKSPNL